MRAALTAAKHRVGSLLEHFGLAWVRALDRRSENTYLCSYPKSGRTWLRFMISAYQVRLFRTDLKLTMANFATVSPNLTPGVRMGLRTRMPDARMVRVYGTHLPYSWLFRGARVIYLKRDLRDVLVSYYHHRKVRGEIPDGLERFVLSPQGLAPALRYSEGWERALREAPFAKICRMNYEDLLTDPAGGLRRCIQFLELPVDESILEAAVQDAAADQLRLLESSAGNYDFTPEQLAANPSARHVRKARAGTYLEEMSPAVAQKIETEIQRCGLDG